MGAAFVLGQESTPFALHLLAVLSILSRTMLYFLLGFAWWSLDGIHESQMFIADKESLADTSWKMMHMQQTLKHVMTLEPAWNDLDTFDLFSSEAGSVDDIAVQFSAHSRAWSMVSITKVLGSIDVFCYSVELSSQALWHDVENHLGIKILECSWSISRLRRVILTVHIDVYE